jgi:hypothetical protein
MDIVSSVQQMLLVEKSGRGKPVCNKVYEAAKPVPVQQTLGKLNEDSWELLMELNPLAQGLGGWLHLQGLSFSS